MWTSNTLCPPYRFISMLIRKLLLLAIFFVASHAYALTAPEAKAIAIGEADARVEALNKALANADDRTAAFIQALANDAVKVNRDQVIVVRDGKGADPVWPITAMVEKPPKGTAPSNLYIMGRYILQPEVFSHLSRMEKGAGGEIQITDAMVHLMKSQAFTAVRHLGRTFDCGSKIGFLAGNVALGLARDDIGPELRSVLKGLL